MLLSLGMLFFFYFVRRLTHNKTKALVATIILASVPAYMSHFIWSLTLSVLLYYVAFYAAEMIPNDRNWWVISGVMTGAILMTQPTTAFKFGIFFGVYWLIKALFDKKWHLPVLGAMILGGLLAILLWWGPALVHWGYPDIITKGLYQGTTSNVLTTTGYELYPMDLFFAAPKANRINNPQGYGPVAFTLFLLSVAFIILATRSYLKKGRQWVFISLLWSVLAFLMIQGGRLPVRMDAHRSWMLLAIFLSIVTAEGIWQLGSLGKKLLKIPMVLTLTVLVGLIVLTSFPAKYAVNTAMWPSGGAITQGEIQGYLWMRDNIPRQTPVFAYGNFEKVLAYGMYSCEWCKDTYAFRQGITNESIDQLYAFLKPRYSYLVMFPLGL